MTNAAVWAPSRAWTPTPQPPYPDPGPDEPLASYDPSTPAVIQTADWTCSCASSAWLLNSLGDDRLGRPWTEWDVVDALRAATYPGAVDPAYGLARADMYDLQTMFEALGYTAERKQYLTVDDVVAVAGRYPLQINGARWYHHSGARAIGDFFASVPQGGRLDEIRLVPTSVNLQPALAAYSRGDDGMHRPYGLMVLQIEGDLIAGIVGFPDPWLFEQCGLPPKLT